MSIPVDLAILVPSVLYKAALQESRRERVGERGRERKRGGERGRERERGRKREREREREREGERESCLIIVDVCPSASQLVACIVTSLSYRP